MTNWKKTVNFVISWRYFSGVSHLLWKKAVDIKPSYNINNKKKRKRKTIWFNPPYSKSVKTNIERIFINLISKHFPPNHKFLKILDKDTTKFSYSCMPNTRPKINNHKKNTATQARQNYATALLKKIAYWMDYV